jgi:hypothetical protein
MDWHRSEQQRLLQFRSNLPARRTDCACRNLGAVLVRWALSGKVALDAPGPYRCLHHVKEELGALLKRSPHSLQLLLGDREVWHVDAQGALELGLVHSPEFMALPSFLDREMLLDTTGCVPRKALADSRQVLRAFRHHPAGRCLPPLVDPELLNDRAFVLELLASHPVEADVFDRLLVNHEILQDPDFVLEASRLDLAGEVVRRMVLQVGLLSRRDSALELLSGRHGPDLLPHVDVRLWGDLSFVANVLLVPGLDEGRIRRAVEARRDATLLRFSKVWAANQAAAFAAVRDAPGEARNLTEIDRLEERSSRAAGA